MSDRASIESQYREMYRAMVAKDMQALSAVLDENFVLIHMTGMRQGKYAFLRAVQDESLHYFDVEHETTDIEILHENYAVLVGHAKVNAAVFGGERHTWRLEQRITLRKKNGTWLMTLSEAGTY